MARVDLVELLRQFAKRTAREHGVSSEYAKRQLSVINSLALRIVTFERQESR